MLKNDISIVNIISLKEIGSTNDYAKSLNDNYKEWTVVHAYKQSAGKGQHDNIWESQENKNLTFSVILNPIFLEPAFQFQLNQAISLSIVDFISQYIKKNVSVKWPNDIYVNKNKISGVLIENTICGNNFSKCIAGIGININQTVFSESITNATSLKTLTGNDFDCMLCLHEYLGFLISRYEQLKNDYNSINTDYLNSLYLFNKLSNFKINGTEQKASILGTDDSGQLILKNIEGKIFICGIKEVVFLH